MTRCFCGCGERAVHFHHCVYAQEIKRATGTATRRDQARQSFLRVKNDPRNLVPVGFACHASHHNRVDPFPLAALPDSVYEFAHELLGGDAAYEYLRRRYDGDDPRLEALIEEAAA